MLRTQIMNNARGKAITVIALWLCLLIPSLLSAAPMLWQVKGAQTFYVMGTIHLPDPRVNDLPDSVEKVFAHVTSLYTEIEMNADLQQRMMRATLLPRGQTLFEVLPESLLKQVNVVLADMRPPLSIEPFANQKIWVVAVALSMLQHQLDNPNELPQDQSLYQRAEQAGKHTGGLETIDEQLSIFDDLSTNQQIKLLQDTVEFMQQAKANNEDVMEKMLSAYLDGSLERLSELMQAYTKDEPFYDEFMERILTERNFTMAERMSSIAARQPKERILFAVGSGHLSGEYGVLTLLEQLGYQVRRLKK